MKQDYSRNVTLNCPTCAGDRFEFDEDLEPEARTYKCADCGRLTAHAELLEENSARLQTTVDEIGREVVQDLQKQLSKPFKGFK